MHVLRMECCCVTGLLVWLQERDMCHGPASDKTFVLYLHRAVLKDLVREDAVSMFCSSTLPTSVHATVS